MDGCVWPKKRKIKHTDSTEQKPKLEKNWNAMISIKRIGSGANKTSSASNFRKYGTDFRKQITNIKPTGV